MKEITENVLEVVENSKNVKTTLKAKTGFEESLQIEQTWPPKMFKVNSTAKPTVEKL